MVARRKSKSRGRFGRVMFALAAALAASLLVMSYLSSVVNPAHAWWMTFFGLLYIPALIICSLFCIWGLLRRSWVVSALLIVLMIPSLILIGRYFQFRGNPVDDTKGDLKIVSYNVGRFAGGRGEFEGLKSKELADHVSRYLREQDADVICLQEFYLSTKYNLKDYFSRQFPGYKVEYLVYTNDKGRFGNVTLSRFKVRGKGKKEFEKSTNLALYTDIEVGGKLIRVYNCHFESYNISPSKTSFRDEQSVEESGRKFRQSARRRPGQVDEVMADIEACAEDVMVVGDFNDNPISYTYRRLIRDRKDAFFEVGKGFGATYCKVWPFLRIDYILYPASLEARWFALRKDAMYSDHYPISASFLVK